MSFFEPPPPPPDPPDEQPQPPWSGPPGNELGVAVPIRYVVVRTEELAILLDGFVAYSTGVELELTVTLRVPLRGRDRHALHAMDEQVRFGFRFADGRKATDGFRYRSPEDDEDGPVLVGRGGSGSDRTLRRRYFLWPMPPPGPLQAVVAWPERGVPETEVEVDAGAIREAAGRVETLWPEEAPPRGGWTSSPMVVSHRAEPRERDG